jgi:hypothetical protein
MNQQKRDFKYASKNLSEINEKSKQLYLKRVSAAGGKCILEDYTF